MPVHSENLPREVSGGTTLDVAAWMARQGYPVHPLAPGTKTPAPNCSDCRDGRHPASECPCHARGGWCHGFHAATTDLPTLSRWWRTEPDFGIGVACGPAGLVVIDVDAHEAPLPDRQALLPGIAIDPRVDLTGLTSGFDTLALLAAYRSRPNPCEDASTLRVRTPSGGMHVWYRMPVGAPRFRCSSGSGSKVALAWQVDVRAVGGYIVAPSTRTKAGAYRPVPGARLPAPLPMWLGAELTRTGHTVDSAPAPAVAPAPGPVAVRTRRGGPRLVASLLDEVRACGASPSGTAFSEKLNRAAFTAGGLAATGHLVEADARQTLLEAADHARPHQPRRNALIVEAGLRAGRDRPINPKERP
ncbi:bifunctional DNA primase/polymerase [Streptomyces sp. NPDC088097]|uniref:bifunctional DNA primase/polymerase n=1 Tax=Streptomyces sp. NPDC088097 TaxID=3365823 RepID=UPI003813C6C9